jgi:hypothetical protein
MDKYMHNYNDYTCLFYIQPWGQHIYIKDEAEEEGVGGRMRTGKKEGKALQKTINKQQTKQQT